MTMTCMKQTLLSKVQVKVALGLEQPDMRSSTFLIAIVTHHEEPVDLCCAIIHMLSVYR